MTEWLKSTPIAKLVTDHWVKDLESTAERMSREYGLGPWKVTELKAPVLTEAEFRGTPVDVDMLAAMCEVGPVAIELLEVRGGSAPFVEWAAAIPDGHWHPVSY